MPKYEDRENSASAALLSEIAHQLNRSIFSFFEQKGDPFVQIKLKSQRSISSHMLKIKLIGPRKSIADNFVVTYGELKKGKRINTHVNQGIEFNDNIERKNINYLLTTNTNAISNLSLRGAERRSNPMKNEIATPFGLAMTTCGVKIFNAFVLINKIL